MVKHHDVSYTTKVVQRSGNRYIQATGHGVRTFADGESVNSTQDKKAATNIVIDQFSPVKKMKYQR